MSVNSTMIASGTSVFVDANVFVYAFAPDPQFGPACSQLLERIELKDLSGFTCSHVVSNVAHRLMTLEACAQFGWPYAGIAARLKRSPGQIQNLYRFRQAVEAVSRIGVNICQVTARHVESAAIISQTQGMLSNDAVVLAVMQEHGLHQLASYDRDFDRVPGISRFEPT